MIRRAKAFALVEHAPDPRTLDSLRLYTVRRGVQINARSQWWGVTRFGSGVERYIPGTRSRVLRVLAAHLRRSGLSDVRVYDQRGALVIR